MTEPKTWRAWEPCSMCEDDGTWCPRCDGLGGTHVTFAHCSWCGTDQTYVGNGEDLDEWMCEDCEWERA
jgi:hypothetical protein